MKYCLLSSAFRPAERAHAGIFVRWNLSSADCGFLTGAVFVGLPIALGGTAGNVEALAAIGFEGSSEGGTGGDLREGAARGERGVGSSAEGLGEGKGTDGEGGGISTVCSIH